jgi:hypothetical protein
MVLQTALYLKIWYFTTDDTTLLAFFEEGIENLRRLLDVSKVGSIIGP